MNKKGSFVFWVLFIVFVSISMNIVTNFFTQQTITSSNIPCEQAEKALLLGIGLPQYKITTTNKDKIFGFEWNVIYPASNQHLKKYYEERCIK